MRQNTAFRAAPGGANATTRAARARDAPTEGATAADDAAPTDGATGAAPVDSTADAAIRMPRSRPCFEFIYLGGGGVI